ncbi:hypothetical protein IAR55_003621 [Kwoniella newhampshirensis]|uniref:Hemerythrin-like domain-containing protein n=1 Tax=Kwoniella newhampshirensis TaxID=1651941 RepID=A0AAW0YMY1_9TREE
MSSTSRTSDPSTVTSPNKSTYAGILITALSLIFAIFALRLSPSAGASLRSAVGRFRPTVTALTITTPSIVSTCSTTATRHAHTDTSPQSFTMAMNAKEFREWNRLADHMDQFHNHFRYEFKRIYELADGSFHKEGMTLARFLREAQQLAHHLEMHHRIETYIFPILAKKMPQFKQGSRESGQHLQSHKKIHEGLEKYEAFLSTNLANPSKYDATELRGILDGFRDVLLTHLDEEVHDLGAESMKAAGWTLDEIRRVPM